MSLKVLSRYRVVVLLVIPALIATFAIVRLTSEEGGSNASLGMVSFDADHRPMPALGPGPIHGDRVSFEEAPQGTAYHREGLPSLPE